MQAQPQSILAARIPSPSSSPPSTPAPSSLTAPRPAALSPLPPTPPASQPLPSLAETSGLAHEGGGTSSPPSASTADLLNMPGVLRPEHQHYATELRLISDRSSQLIHRLLTGPTTHDVPSLTTDAATVRPSKLFRRRSDRASDVLANTSNHAAMLLNLTAGPPSHRCRSSRRHRHLPDLASSSRLPC